MTPDERARLAAEARASVVLVMALLERPTIEALDQSAVELAAAANRIQKITDGGESRDAPVRSMVIGLRKDLQRVALLLRHAWEFRAGTSGQAGYTRKGELTAHPAPTTRWTLKG